jgi:leader peptidase (prepilin peptidase)/N-methyltransferase
MVILIILILGVCLGSFAGATTWRLHEQEKAKSKKRQRELSIIRGRSMCPNCSHTLVWYDLLPLVSWIMLRGRCRYCHESIGYFEPLIELLTATAFISSYFFWPLTFNSKGIILFGFWLIILTVLLVLFIYDFKWMLLPDRLTTPLVGIVLLQLIIHTLFFHGGLQILIGAMWGVLLIAGLFYVLFQVSNGRWIGGGDVKLGISLGLLVGGPMNALLVLFISSLLGTLTAIPLLIKANNKRQLHLPFGPFLIVATFIVVLFGNQLNDWLQMRLLIS